VSLAANTSVGASSWCAARAHGSYERRLARLAAVDVLIIDDLGLHPLRHDEPTDLYELIRVRYEAGAIVITSNRDMEEWPPTVRRCAARQRSHGPLAAPRACYRHRGRSITTPRAKQ